MRSKFLASAQTPVRALIQALALVTLTAACSQRPAPIEDRSLAREVRAEAAATTGVVEVFPLGGGEDAALVTQARAAEAEGALEQAAILVSQALEMAPQDAGHWQYLAEIELEQGQYQAAIDHARHSYELGPQVGQLCARNWLTVEHASRALNNELAASSAADRAQRCAVQRAR